MLAQHAHPGPPRNSSRSAEELEELHAHAADLLGLSFSSPQPVPAPMLTRSFSSNNAIPPTKPVAIPASTAMATRKSSRRESVGSVEKKKGGFVGMNRKESFGTRSGRGSSVTIADHRLSGANTTPPPIPSLSTSATTANSSAPGSGILSPASLPPSTVILQPGDAEDGEILDYDMVERNEKGGKRRSGSVFRCESCSKIYRHPSCLVKHRWQHSPHWQESSKLLLSKHQQVQVLEAATILVHLHPEAGTSLPEDKSLWPAAVAPTAHPMPSISYTDSRQRSKATSTHPSRLANPAAFARSSRSSTTPAPPTEARIAQNPAAIRSDSAEREADEEATSAASSPASSNEDDIHNNPHPLGLTTTTDYSVPSMFSSSYKPPMLSRSYSSSSQPSAPISFPRRESFTSSTTNLMGQMGLTSPTPGHASLYPSSPAGAVNASLGASPSFASLSLSHSHSFSGVASSYGALNSPYGTSPGLPMPRSSIRGGAVEEEDEEEEESEESGRGGWRGRYQRGGSGSGSGRGSGSDERSSPPKAVKEDDEDEMDMDL